MPEYRTYVASASNTLYWSRHRRDSHCRTLHGETATCVAARITSLTSRCATSEECFSGISRVDVIEKATKDVENPPTDLRRDSPPRRRDVSVRMLRRAIGQGRRRYSNGERDGALPQHAGRLCKRSL